MGFRPYRSSVSAMCVKRTKLLEHAETRISESELVVRFSDEALKTSWAISTFTSIESNRCHFAFEFWCVTSHQYFRFASTFCQSAPCWPNEWSCERLFYQIVIVVEAYRHAAAASQNCKCRHRQSHSLWVKMLT